MPELKGWFRENSTLVYFLFAQSVVLAGGGASALAYFTNLENRVHTMEVRGAAYTVARMDEMKLAIARLEQSIEKNEQSIERIKDVLLKNGLRP
jgi:hypothetical protein